MNYNDLNEENVNDVHNMTDEEFAEFVATIPKLSNRDVKKYMQIMSRHKPVNEKEKAARKVKNRKKNKAARKARRNNR